MSSLSIDRSGLAQKIPPANNVDFLNQISSHKCNFLPFLSHLSPNGNSPQYACPPPLPPPLSLHLFFSFFFFFFFFFSSLAFRFFLFSRSISTSVSLLPHPPSSLFFNDPSLPPLLPLTPLSSLALLLLLRRFFALLTTLIKAPILVDRVRNGLGGWGISSSLGFLS